MTKLNDITVTQRTYARRPDTHTHGYAQFVMPLQGAVWIRTESHSVELDDRTLLFIPPRCEHRFYANVPNQCLVADIPAQKIPYAAGGFTHSFDRPIDATWRGIRTLLVRERNAAAAGLLYPYLAHYLFRDQQSASIRYIHDHYDHPITVDTLAALEHYETSSYTSWFKRHTGMTPCAYIQHVRLDKAKELLGTTDFSIQDIALQVGFAHQSALTRLFRQYEQETPSQYRSATRRRSE
ncbi:helix-turn-helix domain-containing protein [Sulfobacillus harzensis]|uniref:helix-turn-helix domain-containing protein n=1 Tax=Sulfobacillus harzensis TaxID=2729629 RepID=UPI001A9B9021